MYLTIDLFSPILHANVDPFLYYFKFKLNFKF
jgi:hypothetical protein